MEARGTFSIEGCVETAWIIGLVKNFDGLLEGKKYHGWIDFKTNKPIHIVDIKK